MIGKTFFSDCQKDMCSPLFELANQLNLKCQIKWGDSSRYDLAPDSITIERLPPLQLAHKLAHELIHATGHPARLNRFTPTNFAEEEFTADVGGALLIVAMGLAKRARIEYLPFYLKLDLLREQSVYQGYVATRYLLGREPDCSITQECDCTIIRRNY